MCSYCQVVTNSSAKVSDVSPAASHPLLHSPLFAIGRVYLCTSGVISQVSGVIPDSLVTQTTALRHLDLDSTQLEGTLTAALKQGEWRTHMQKESRVDRSVPSNQIRIPCMFCMVACVVHIVCSPGHLSEAG
jgi:hypothetical protein